MSEFLGMVQAARVCVPIFLLTMTLCHLAPARPLHTDKSEYGSPGASPVPNEKLLCPSSVDLEEAMICGFPPHRDNRSRNSCALFASIKDTEKYCLKMDDDTHNVTCYEHKTADGEDSKTVQCYCHFFNEYSQDQFCHLYTYTKY